MNRSNTTFSGTTSFTIVWLGQIVSLLGTAMSGFAFTLWAFEITGKATPLALVGFFFITPIVFLGPFIGVLVDRYNRRLMMMVSDLAAAFVSLIALILNATGNLQIWHLYLISVIMGIFQGFQWPAYSAAITLMLPKEQYARANGMMEMAGNSSRVFAPLLAGILIAPLGLSGILVIDLSCAAIAIGTLLFVDIPQPPRVAAAAEEKASFLNEAGSGFRFILARPSLLGLQSVFLFANFFSALAAAVLAPMILARTGNDEMVLGSVQSAGAIGGVIGALAMSLWGGPKRRVHGVLLSWFCIGLLGHTMFGLAQALPAWVAFLFARMFFSPIVNGSNQAIWQAKVPPEIQGRVFTARQLIAWLVSPLSNLLAGPLADQVLEPAMAHGGALVPMFGGLVGVGSGAGMALIFVFGGLFAAVAGLGGYLFPVVRNAEDILPDQASINREVVVGEPALI